MKTINITCDNCGIVHTVKRTGDIPGWVISMGCNWCPGCQLQEDYEEWYNPENEGDEPEVEDIPVGDNQLMMPFIFDELGIPIAEQTF